MPDNGGLAVEETSSGVRLRQPPESGTGICKSLEISLNDERPIVVLTHTLENAGAWPVELAPWAITQMKLGGVVVLPQQLEPLDSSGLLPNRHLVLWPYTSWQDTRLCLYDDFVLIHAAARSSACKVGYTNQLGWIGYLRAGVFFVKRFQPQPEKPHADRGCNVEAYCNERVIELETLGPLCRLEPGQSVTHVEMWELYTGLVMPQTIDGVRDLVQSVSL